MDNKSLSRNDKREMKRRILRCIVQIVAVVVTFLIPSMFASLAQGDTQMPPVNNIQGLAWSPHDATLALAGIIDNEVGVSIFNSVAQATSRLQMPETPFNMLSVAWSPDGMKLAALASGEVYTYYIWDIVAGNLIAAFEQQGETSDFSIYWSPDSTQLATVADYSVFIRDGATGEVIATLREVDSNTDVIQTIAWSRDGENLLVASGENVVRIWDTITATKISEFTVFYPISSIALSPDGAALAVGGDNGSIHVLDATTGTSLYMLQNSTDQRLNFIEWNPSGEQVAGADIRGNIAIWDTNTQQIIDRIEGNSAEVLQDIAYSPYGGRLAYSSRTMDEGQSVQRSAELVTESLANGAVQIVVPAPSLERLQAIAEACGAPPAVEQALAADVQADQLSDFVAQVEALPEDTIPPACAADLIAVAEALQSE